MADWPYNSTRWQKLRKRQLAAFPLCETCKATRKWTVVANHVDHRKAISEGGDPFPPIGTGLASLCASCHSQKTARSAEAGAVKTTRPIQPRPGCDAAGNPIDPLHPWNLTSSATDRTGGGDA
jgi:5-methylcytosine-specific restriction protein A